jgi:hypothetical protein
MSGTTASSSEHGNETDTTTKYEKFIDLVSDW